MNNGATFTCIKTVAASCITNIRVALSNHLLKKLLKPDTCTCILKMNNGVTFTCIKTVAALCITNSRVALSNHL